MSPQSIAGEEDGMRVQRISLTLATLAVAVLGGWVTTRLVASEEEAPTAPPRIHTDAPAMARGVVDGAGAMLRDDREAATAAIKQIQKSCRELFPEEADPFGPGVRSLDQALHKVLGRTLEYLGAREYDTAFDEFIWVQRICRECHTLARGRGLLPSTGPLWPATLTETKHVETTHTVGEEP
jgi:hypothetical protein